MLHNQLFPIQIFKTQTGRFIRETRHQSRGQIYIRILDFESIEHLDARLEKCEDCTKLNNNTISMNNKISKAEHIKLVKMKVKKKKTTAKSSKLIQINPKPKCSKVDLRKKISFSILNKTEESSYESKRQLLRNYLMSKERNDVKKEEKKDDVKKRKKTGSKSPSPSISPEQIVDRMKNDENGFMIVERFQFLLGSLYFVLGVVAFVFYSNKTALYLTSIPCSLHMFKHYILKLNKMFVGLNSSLVNLIINSIWLIFVIAIIVYYLQKDDMRLDKIEFRDEIILHVGLIIYAPIVLASSYFSCRLFVKNIEYLDVYG